MEPQRKLEQIAGRVSLERVRKGTASEHVATVLHTDGGERLVLQRQGGNPFDDAHTRALDGRDVRLEGYRLGGTFRFTRTLDG